MDTFDSHRPTVPARLPGIRPGHSALRTTAGAAAAPSPSPLSIRVVLRGTRRYWWLILMLTMVGSAAIGAGVYLNVKPNYRAASYLRVDPAVANLYNVQTSGESLDPFLATQVELITSPNVLSAAAINPTAVKLPRIMSSIDPVQELKKVIAVRVMPQTYLIEVSMTSTNSSEAATLVNAVVDAFMESNNEWTDGATRANIKNLESYRVDLQNQTDELERRWKDLVVRGDVDNVILQENRALAAGPKVEQQGPSRSSITIEEYKKIRNEIQAVNLELASARAIQSSIKDLINNAAKHPSPAADQALIDDQVERRFKADPEVVALSARIHDARMKLANVERLARAGSDPAEQAPSATSSRWTSSGRDSGRASRPRSARRSPAAPASRSTPSGSSARRTGGSAISRRGTPR